MILMKIEVWVAVSTTITHLISEVWGSPQIDASCEIFVVAHYLTYGLTLEGKTFGKSPVAIELAGDINVRRHGAKGQSISCLDALWWSVFSDVFIAE